LLTAIRIATYGESLSLEFTIPGTENERAFEANLVEILDELVVNEYQTSFTHNEFTIETAPMTYKQFTDVALKTFEEQRILKIVNDDDMSEGEKIQKFNETFQRLTDINIANVFNSVKSITVDGNTVTDTRHLADFLENAPVDVYKSILDHVDEQRKKFTVKPRKIVTSEEDRADGAPDTMEIPINFDASNFFASGS
jgi:predicted HAD superfamily phosphohydrolase